MNVKPVSVVMDYIVGIHKGLKISPTAETVLAFQAWAIAEGGSAKFNLLNTTLVVPGSTQFNKIGVQNYPDLATGIKATVDTLRERKYLTVRNALRAGTSAHAVLVAVSVSPWGTGSLAEDVLAGWNLEEL